jgi:hypothetical protein
LTANTENFAQSRSTAAPDDDSILSIEIGGKSIGAYLEVAIASGRVIQRPDGKFELAEVPSRSTDLFNDGEFPRPCLFLNKFMFTHIYGAKAVPSGCRDCYKVKVTSATLRQLIAVKKISEDFSCLAKSTADVNYHGNQSLYATYFYLLGLDKARAIYHQVRAKIVGEPKLGVGVKMVIKRGCTNYEHACGPSNRYTFDPRLADIERYFWSRFVSKKSEQGRGADKKYDAMKLLELVRTAYRIGDDTYKDFTGGKDLYPPTITYDPDESAEPEPISR